MSIPALLVSLDYIRPVWRFHYLFSFDLGSFARTAIVIEQALSHQFAQEAAISFEYRFR